MAARANQAAFSLNGAPLEGAEEWGDLKIHEEIGRGAFSQVYRATRGENPYAVKVVNSLSFKDSKTARLQFVMEAAYLAMLKHPGLVEVHHVGEAQGNSYLVMEYVDGQSLAHLLQKNGKVAEGTLLTYAKTLASVLSQVHGSGMIHRDIKPQNILINSRGEAKLIDFGFVFRHEEETEPSNRLDEVAGTFLYSAPEQTGMLKRPMDGRTDLYALGVVLFECASGRPPFQHSDAGELLRMHAVVEAPRLRDLVPEISPAFEAIIAKLMAKDPDDRYQTAKGLFQDLENIANWNESTVLGAGDHLVHATREVPLIGRGEELSQINAILKAVFEKKGSVLLLEGAPGNGKSRLARELCQQARAIAKSRGRSALVLSGKSSLSEQSPLSMIRSLVEGHLQSLEQLPESEKQKSLDKVKKAAFEYASVLRRFSKRFVALFPEVKDVPEEHCVQDLFYQALGDFIQKLSKLHGILVLFIDDVQWLDPSSFQCLKRLSQEIGKLPLLMACTARNDEESKPALLQFVTALGASLSCKLELKPIPERFLGELIQAHLGEKKVSDGLIQSITHLSEGNPFAVGEYLRATLENGFLYPKWDGWNLDTKGLESLKLSTDVIDLVIQRMAKLPDHCKEILNSASVLGSRFSTELLPSICAVEKSEVDQALASALQAHLIERTHLDGEYQFVHDRVQEAFLKNVPPGVLKKIHQRIAEALETKKSKNDTSFSITEVFALANHALLGESEKNPQLVYQAQVQAGVQALQEHSNAEAYKYFQNAVAFQSGEIDPLFEEMCGEACFRLGRGKEALSHFQRCLDVLKDHVHRAKIYRKRAKVYLSMRDVSGKQEADLAYLELGHPQLKLSRRFILNCLGYWILGFFVQKWPFLFPRFEGKQREAVSVLVDIPGPEICYRNFKVLEMVLFTFRNSYFAYRLGPSPQLAYFYSIYGVILASARKKKHSDAYSRKSIQLAEKIGDQTVKAVCSIFSGVALASIGNSRESRKIFWNIMTYYSTWSPLENYMTCSTVLTTELLLLGDIVSMKSALGLLMKRLKNSQSEEHSSSQTGGFITFIVYHNFISHFYSWSGQFIEAKEELQKVRKFMEETKNLEVGILCSLLMIEILFLIEQEEFGPPLQKSIDEFNQVRIAPARTPYVYRGAYLAVAYARLAQYQHLAKTQGTLPGNLEETLHLVRLAVADAQKTALVPILLSHCRVFEAALLRVERNVQGAKELLLQAENLANDCDSEWVRYEVAIERARLFQLEDSPTNVQYQAQIAYDIATRGGWTNRAKRVKGEFDLVLDTTDSVSKFESRHAGIREHGNSQSLSRSPSAAGSSSIHVINQERSLDALLRVSLASARILDPDLQARHALDEVIKILGAERGFLFLLNPETSKLEVKSGRDSIGNDIRELAGFSSTVVEKVRERGKPLIVSGTDEGAALGSKSVIANNLRSIMATPVQIGDRVMGVFYLDSRVVKGLFSETDLNLFQAIANHIAVSLETARAATVELEKQALVKDVEAKRAVQTILDNLDQGFFTFDQTGLVQPGVSRSVQELFQTDPVGQKVEEVLDLEPKKKTEFHQLLPFFFNGRFKTIQQILPRFLISKTGRYIELDYRPIQGSNQKVEKVILVSTDRTKERELQTKVQAEIEYAKMVIQILKNRSSFIQFVVKTKQWLEWMESEVKTKSVSEWNITEFSRIMHTIKGESASFHVQELKERVHQFEERLIPFREQKSSPQLENLWGSIREELPEIRKILEKFCQDHRKIIGDVSSKAANSERPVSVNSIEKIAGCLAKVLPSDSKEYQMFYEELVLQPVEQFFAHFEAAVMDLAERQKKDVEFQIIPPSTPIRVRMNAYEGILGGMIHAFTNAVDHGIEIPKDRESKGKKPRGRIEVSFEKQGNRLKIQVKDDGRGINPDIIGRVAVEKGVITSEKLSSMSADQIIQLVFAPGFSSKTEVTEVSGRGVGLDVVQVEAGKLSGKAWVESELGQGSRVIIEVPVIQ